MTKTARVRYYNIRYNTYTYRDFKLSGDTKEDLMDKAIELAEKHKDINEVVYYITFLMGVNEI